MSAYIRYVPPLLGGGGGSTALTVGTIDSQTPSANGAVISASVLYMQSASATVPGLVNTTTQTFAGQKTFSTGITVGTIKNTSGVSTIFVNSQTLNSSATQTTVDWGSMTLTDTSNKRAMNWGATRQLYDSTGSASGLSIDFTNRWLVPSGTGGVPSIDWQNYALVDSGFTSQLVWSTSGVSIESALLYTSSLGLLIKDNADNTKIIALKATGNTTGKKLTISSSQTTNGTLVIPDLTGSETVATLSHVQTFTGATTFSALTTFSGRIVDSVAGAASAPAISATGAPFTGGTATTTKPLVLFENAGTTNNWSTNGTILGLNPATGFAGNLIDAQVNAVIKFRVDSGGTAINGSSPIDSFSIGGSPVGFLNSNLGSASTQGFAAVQYSTNVFSNSFGFYKARGTSASPTIVSSGDILGAIGAFGFDGSTFQAAAQIVFAIDTTPGAADMPGSIIFQVTPDGSATAATALTIKNDKTLTAAAYGTGILHSTSSGVISSSAVNLSNADVTGTLAAARFPALTGDVTTSAGSLATTAAATQANIATLSKSTGVAVHGTNTNDSAASGYVGEYISANPGGNVNSGSSGNYTTITSISLTAGDWDVEGQVQFNAGTLAAGTSIGAAISLTTNATDTTASGGFHLFSGATITAASVYNLPTGNRRISVAGTTTVYLVGQFTGTIGTANFGTDSFIGARRVR